MDTPNFTVALRGYDRRQVDDLIARAVRASASSDQQERASARAALQDPELNSAMRGYDREQVDLYLVHLATQLR